MEVGSSSKLFCLACLGRFRISITAFANGILLYLNLKVWSAGEASVIQMTITDEIANANVSRIVRYFLRKF